MTTLTAALRAEYQTLFDTCQIRPERLAEVHRTAQRILDNQARYESVAAAAGMPWHVVGVIHNMEGSLNFATHLHNGDSLQRRTVQVPRGRPPTGEPPFTWEESALDALQLEGYTAWTDWSVPGTLYKWERYNGWGYRKYHPEVKSPYLWSFTNHYTRGKYSADGLWAPGLVSKQVGAAALLRRLAELSAIEVQVDVEDPALAKLLRTGVLGYAPSKVTPGGMELQQFLNRFPGIFLREDGKLGQRTSDAFMEVFGQYLLGDPRA